MLGLNLNKTQNNENAEIGKHSAITEAVRLYVKEAKETMFAGELTKEEGRMNAAFLYVNALREAHDAWRRENWPSGYDEAVKGYKSYASFEAIGFDQALDSSLMVDEIFREAGIDIPTVPEAKNAYNMSVETALTKRPDKPITPTGIISREHDDLCRVLGDKAGKFGQLDLVPAGIRKDDKLENIISDKNDPRVKQLAEMIERAPNYNTVQEIMEANAEERVAIVNAQGKVETASLRDRLTSDIQVSADNAVEAPEVDDVQREN